MFLKDIKQNTTSILQKSGIETKEAIIETEILLGFVFGLSKKDIILNPEKELQKEKLEIYNNLIERRIKEKIPVQYLTNKAYFMGEEFYVDENVLIPRPETEILVEEVVSLDKNFQKIIDIGTGSGCIACMISKFFAKSSIYACDISEKALEVAKINAKNLGVEDKITFIQSDIFENINENFDIIISNPPYISINEKETLQPEVTLHEPHSALFVEDEKGVSFYAKLAHQAKERLNKGGYLAVEIGFNQSAEVVKIFEKSGFKGIKIIKDYNQIDRVIVAKN